VPVAERGRPGVEFLASTDPWFRPVDLLDGPDGSMYVVDMHRAVIEHPAWMPKELQNREDQRWGDAAGRIYRIVPAESSGGNKRFDFATTQTIDWIAALSSDNRWARVTASRKLSETLVPMAGAIAAGGEKSGDFERIVASLHGVVANETPGRAVSRALWLLRSIGELKAENLAVAVAHPDAAVRTQAVRLVADNRQTSQASATTHWPATADWLAKLAADPSPIVRYQWLLEIAPIADESLIESIIVATTSGEADSPTDRIWLSRAVSLVQEPIAPQLVAGLLATKPGDPQQNLQTLLPLVKRLGWSGSAQTLTVLLENQSESGEASLFEEFASGLATRGTPWSKLTAELSPTIVKRLGDRLAQDRKIVSDGKQPIAARVASLRRVGLDRSPDTLALCQSIVDSDGGELYVEALGLMRHFSAEDTAKRLVSRIVELPPKAATATVAAMVGNAKWTPALIDALQTKSIPWGLIDPTSLGRLERHSDKSIADRVRTLRSEMRPEGKQSLVARYSEVLGQSADVAAGKAHFVRHCAACHKIDNQGVAVGPDISDMRTQTPEQILLSILDPSAAIDANYYRYAVLTTDGQLIEGLLEDSNETSVTLKLQEGLRRTIPRDEVEQLRATGVSMMPEGFENQLDPAAMRDLVAYVKRWRLLENHIPLGSLPTGNR
jgi:putative heme-binding domain-containing protein